MKKTITIQADEVPQVLAKHERCLFGYVEFRKGRYNTIRKMWFIRHVPDKVKVGGTLKYKPRKKRVSIVYDIFLKECRAFRWDTIKKLSVNGVSYKVIPREANKNKKWSEQDIFTVKETS